MRDYANVKKKKKRSKNKTAFYNLQELLLKDSNAQQQLKQQLGLQLLESLQD
jgi:hypothetical protein